MEEKNSCFCRDSNSELSSPYIVIYIIVTFDLWIYMTYLYKYGPGSSVGVATDYGLDCPGSNTSGDEIFRRSRPALVANRASCKMGTGSFPGVE